MKPIRALLPLLIVFVLGCGTNVGNGKIRMELTDAPAEYDAVNVDLGAVQAHYIDENSGESRWITLVPDGGEHNLLELQNDVTAVLGEQSLDEGRYTELRMIVQSASVVSGSTTTALTIPSAAEAGIKFPYDFKIEDGKTYRMVIDFDAEKSVKELGVTGELLMEPVIQVKSFTAVD